MFDFTREIKLDPKNYRLYRYFQAILYLLAFLAAVYLSYLIAFPHKNFFFTFTNRDSRENNIQNPRLKNASYPDDGKLKGQRDLVFNTSITNDYSRATVTFETDKDSDLPSLGKISMRRSYEAFMLPTSGVIGFRSGALLENDGQYYIVSDGTLRRFRNISTLNNLGYSKEQFLPVSSDEIKYNRKGDDILSAQYPNSALFRIEDNYYVLENQTLKRFVSDNAYLSLHAPAQAIGKDPGFLGSFPVSEDLAGFADGSLVSNGDSVYILSDRVFYPIDDASTFVNKGFEWQDVVPVGTDELAIYEKGKLFNIRTFHLDGTIFKSIGKDKYYIIENNQRYSLSGEAAAKSWNRVGLIEVSEEALDTRVECQTKKVFLTSRTYSCSVPLAPLADFIGFSYELNFFPDQDIRIDSVSVEYAKDITKNNFKNFLLGLYNSIRVNYGLAQNR